MLYTSNLLKRRISLDANPQTIAQELTLKTCEIEETIVRTMPDGVVIGYTTSVIKHENADTLFVCQIDCGPKGIFQIITGGENIKADQYVAAALPDTYLPVIDLQIGSRTMRGVESRGMICSKEELGIQEDGDQHWIRLLSEDFDDLQKSDLGTPLGSKYPRLLSCTREVDNKTITHRPDMTGHFGLAVEISTLWRDDPHAISYQHINQSISTMKHIDPLLLATNSRQSSQTIKILSPGCHVYSLIEGPNIKVQSSSFYTRMLLRDAGLSPRSNRIDFSNIFMLHTGQPLHCFDADTIQGTIVVRNAQDGEQATDLFGKTHTLDSHDIIICDDTKILAIAGVIGCAGSGISATTTRVYIEMANFDGVSVRKTALRLSSRTDASMRFEKEINPEYTSRLVPILLDELQYFSKDLHHGGTETTSIKVYISDNAQQLISSQRSITGNIDDLRHQITSQNPSDQDVSIIQSIITSLGYDMSINNRSYTINVPFWRGLSDISIHEDLVEEIARIYGYNTITPISGQHSMMPTTLQKPVSLRRSCEEVLTMRYQAQQVETYPRVSPTQAGLIDSQIYSRLLNSIAPENSSLRSSIIPSLLNVVKKNEGFYEQGCIYDIGQVRTQQGEQTQCGIITRQNQSASRQDDSFLKLKEIVLNTLSHLGAKDITTTFTEYSYNHPKKQATYSIQTHEGQKVGATIAQLHPLIIEQRGLEIHKQLAYATINLSTIGQQLPSTDMLRGNYQTIQDQIILRDLNFVIDRDQSFEQLLAQIHQTNNVIDINIFDIYQGDALPSDKKSIAISISIQGDQQLNTEQINTIMDQAIQNAQSTGAILRKDFV